MAEDGMVETYRAGRRIKLAPELWREPGELVPEAHTWFRLESYLHTGQLRTASVGEAELRAAVGQFCPELGPRVLTAAGLRGTPAPALSAPGAKKTRLAKG